MTKFETEYNKQLAINLAIIRRGIIGPDTLKKILKYAKKWDINPVKVRYKILNDDLFAFQFIKDPSRQNIYRNIAADMIAERLKVNGLRVLPLTGNSTLNIELGAFYTQKTETTSRLDIVWEINGDIFYAKHAYARGFGGSQHNQYQKMRQFVRNCSGNEEVLFFALCDGDFYTNKRLQELRKLAGDAPIIVCHTEDISSMCL
jgi:hypothetical protein